MEKNNISSDEVTDGKEELSPVDLIEALEQKCSGCHPLCIESDGFYKDDGIFY